MYDSTGMLSVMDRYGRPGQARWIPLLDSNMLARKQGKDETYWPVGVTENQFMCVILKVCRVRAMMFILHTDPLPPVFRDPNASQASPGLSFSTWI